MFYRPVRYIVAFVIALSLCSVASPVVAEEIEDLLLQAQAMMNKGKPQRAYDTLIEFENELAGIPEYDYMLGTAALDSGQANYAVIALQRAVAVRDNFVGARLDLARSYYTLGEMNDAEIEFQRVLDYKPPRSIKDIVARYLASIRGQRQSQKKFFTNLFLSGQGGRDSNANSATSSETFLGFRLNDASRQTASSFYTGTGGLSFSLVPNQKFAMSAGGSYQRRDNLEAEFVNSSVISANGGMQFTGKHNQLALGGNAARVDVAGALSNYNAFATAQLRHNIDVRDFINVVVRGGAVRNTAAYNTNDINQAMVGVGFTTYRDSWFLPAITATSIYGRSLAVQTDSTQSASFSGLRAQASRKLGNIMQFSVSGSVIRTDYDTLFFDALERHDTKADMTGGLDWYFNKNFMMQMQFNSIYNFSSIDLYEYKRFEYSVGLQVNI